MKFILEQHNRLHVGDRNAGIQLLASRCGQFCGNTIGLHPAANGESTNGKTDSEQSMLHLIPIEGKMVGNVSTKALYYMDLKPNTIVFVDDINANNDEFIRLLKTAMNNFQTGSPYTVVSDGKTLRVGIPSRTAIWITKVSAAFEDQLSNRLMSVQVDGSTEQDDTVRKRQVEQARTGDMKYLEDEKIWTCREIFRILEENLIDVNGKAVEVVIPFADEVSALVEKDNRRNYLIVIDMIKAFAVLNFMQRERTDDGKIIADKADWDIVKPVWDVIKPEQETKLTKNDLVVLEAIKKHCKEHKDAINSDAKYEDLQKLTGFSRSKLSKILNGEKGGDGGLLAKVPELSSHDLSERKDDVNRTFTVFKYNFPETVKT